LNGFIGPAIHCETLHKRTTWCSINKTKSIETRITNLSNTKRTITSSATPTPTFICINPTIQLLPKESITIIVTFAPSKEDKYTCTLTCTCSGGEFHSVKHHTVCGNPLILQPISTRKIVYPEDNYGNIGLSLIPKKRVSSDINSVANDDDSNGITVSKKKHLLDATVAQYSIDDGRRAVEAWHSNVCRTLKNEKKVKMIEILNYQKKKSIQLLTKM
jgi:hypothetical protein